jgi:hypothetical protein
MYGSTPIDSYTVSLTSPALSTDLRNTQVATTGRTGREVLNAVCGFSLRFYGLDRGFQGKRDDE